MFTEYCHSIAVQGRELQVEKLVVTERQKAIISNFEENNILTGFLDRTHCWGFQTWLSKDKQFLIFQNR